MSELGTILLVEDNPDDYESTVRSFTKANLMNPIHWSADGQDALDYLRKHGKYEGDSTAVTPALILLDLNMPGLDGRKVLALIKAERDLRILPVVVLSTSVDQMDINKSYELGASSYIQKPVGFDGLIKAAAQIKGYWFGVAILPQTPRASIDGFSDAGKTTC